MAFDIFEMLFGRSPEMKQASKFTPQQQDFQSMLLQMLGGPTGEGMNWLQQILGGDESAFAEFEAPIKRQFEQEVVPGIAERFAGMGTGGAQNSSAMQQTMGRAGQELSENLAAMRAGLKSDALSKLAGLMGIGQQQGVENMYQPYEPGVFDQFARGAGAGAGKSGMQWFLGG